MAKGILIDYGFCTDCQTCMMACQVEHDLPEGHQGVTIQTIGIWPIDKDKNEWQYDFIPTFTDECDLCKERTDKGELPTCVKHCLADVMTYGEIEDLARQMSGRPKQVLYAPKASAMA